ncbi:sensor histidine kinase [Roseivirga sp.]|uniref:sensor histidine kinase n=1 Tax=Roseivirga sp. TaxID=1964215 RepID=UPI003B520F72
MAKPGFENLLFRTPRILWHIIFWTVYILFFGIVYGSFDERYGMHIMIQLIDALVQMPAVYITLYVLMPKLLYKQKYGAFFLYIALVVIVFATLLWFEYVFIEHPVFWPNDSFQSPLINVGKILKMTSGIYPVLFIAVVIKWFKYWYQEQKKNQQLVEDKLEAELKFLKSQIHPHFLFNTLNNLYALTLKQSKDAPEVVLKLSDLLNYMLYECNADKVPLSKEIALVRDYIELEKIRYGSRLNVNMTVNNENGDESVSPLLILPFVENAFKHGASEEIEDSWISIDLSLKHRGLTLKVENSKSNHDESEDRFSYKEGIGLKNVKRRLEILYPESHELNIHESSDSFLVVLKLNF